AEFESVAGPATANSFQLSIHPSNLAGVGGNTNKLTIELARAFSELAADRGWRLEGPVTVQVVPEEAIPRERYGARPRSLGAGSSPGPILWETDNCRSDRIDACSDGAPTATWFSILPRSAATMP
ncbi:MAG TPA: FhaA domain-containing protein, partial [Acidimicrobiia bacterium]|nr:FhaA domain-containing protein [Acidimicrobiia bacterium]